MSAHAKGVNDIRLARLRRGINLPYWFWFGPESLDEAEFAYGDADLQQISSLGFSFVRVPVHFDFLYNETSDTLLKPAALTMFDRALERIQHARLAVVVDIHSTTRMPEEEPICSVLVERGDEYVDLFIAFWESLAGHLHATTDPDRVFLQPLNEPVFAEKPASWSRIQQRLLAAIRAHAPDHTLLATGAPWSQIDALTALEPLPDPNIVYAFHFFEPLIFTHQGASWSEPYLHHLQSVPYPATSDSITLALERADDAETEARLRSYGEQHWDRQAIADAIQPAVDWGQRHHRPLLCAEFGVYAQHAPHNDRVDWLHDVRTTLEAHAIGWAMWDYKGDFGLLDQSTAVINHDIVDALGLTQS